MDRSLGGRSRCDSSYAGRKSDRRKKKAREGKKERGFQGKLLYSFSRKREEKSHPFIDKRQESEAFPIQ